MTFHRHVLEGCAPTPLAHYLKALGILRIVSEQKDPSCRGAWHNDHFVLATVLSREELQRFFLEEYRPTPIFNPWGARSGYFPGGSEKTARGYLSRLTSTQDARFEDWRQQIALIKDAVASLGGTKPEEKDEQYALIARIGSFVRGAAQAWLASTVPLGPGPDSSYKPPILGTGGNEGSGSYTSAYLQALVEALCEHRWDSALTQSLDGNVRLGSNWSGTFGQFIPDGNGCAWDFLLALEGAVIFQSTVTRRSSSTPRRSLSSPFQVGAWAAGAAGVAVGDEYEYRNGRASPGRGEQWFPLWTSFSSFAEISKLIEDGRASVGRFSASSPIHFARAIATFGVSRGVTEFLRFGYMQRNNLATHFAVSLGRVQVPPTVTPQSRLVDDIAPWMDRLHRLARGKGAPARLQHVERVLADAVFRAVTHNATAVDWQGILRACVSVERIQVGGTAIAAGPIPRLSAEWLAACDDGSPEFRLALALGSAAAAWGQDGKPFDPIRHHWLPLETKNPRKFATNDGGLRHDVRVVAHGRNPEADLMTVLGRRTTEAAQAGGRHPQLLAANGAEAGSADLAAWIEGTVDTLKCVELARAFMAVDWTRWKPHQVAVSRTTSRSVPDEAWATLRLNALSWPLDGDCDIPLDPAIVRRLAAGDVSEAVRLALRRLGAHGIQPTVRSGFGDAALARRWGSALAFPISQRTALRLLHQLQPETKETHHVR